MSIGRPVDPQLLAHRCQLQRPEPRCLGQPCGAHHRYGRAGLPTARRAIEFRLQEAPIEPGVMRDQRPPVDAGDDLVSDVVERRGICEVGLRNVVDILTAKRTVIRADKPTDRLAERAVAIGMDDRYLDNAVRLAVEAGGFGIENRKRRALSLAGRNVGEPGRGGERE